MNEERSRLPEELELMAPGPELAAVLASVDRDCLSGKDRVRLLQARHRLAAHVQGELYADLNAVRRAEPAADPDVVATEDPDDPYPWASTEIAFALRWTHTAASIRLDQAIRMVEDLPAVQEALSAGRIDVPKALVLCDEVTLLAPELARRIVDRLIDKAPELTTGQLRAKLRRLVIAADPQAATNRAKAQVNRRRVEITQDHHQLASIAGYDLLPHRVAAGYERLTAIARAAKAAGDPRRIDELRADALLDLLIGEGIAVGEPIIHGGLDQPTDHRSHTTATTEHQPAAATSTATNPVPEPADRDTPWPDAPANPDLLDAAADPPAADPEHADDAGAEPVPDLPPPDQPPAAAEDGDPAVDPDHEKLRPYWLAGFEQLAATRPDPSRRGAMPSPRRGVIDLQMSLTTLMGLDDLPAELAGFGPLLADIARQTAQQRPDLQLRFSVYDQVDQLIAHGTTKVRPRWPTGPDRRRTNRRPTAAVAALVRARNRTCTAPGCRIPSLRCELDHIVTWAAHGETEPNNLHPPCTRHHQFRHQPGADVIALSPGTIGWQTPLGMQYVTRPDPPLYDDHRYIHPPLPGDP